MICFSDAILWCQAIEPGLSPLKWGFHLEILGIKKWINYHSQLWINYWYYSIQTTILFNSSLFNQIKSAFQFGKLWIQILILQFFLLLYASIIYSHVESSDSPSIFSDFPRHSIFSHVFGFIFSCILKACIREGFLVWTIMACYPLHICLHNKRVVFVIS